MAALLQTRRARRRYVCHHCREWIEPGEQYLYTRITPGWDYATGQRDAWETIRTHGRWWDDCPINTSRPNTSGRMTLHESLELIRERYGDAIRQLGEQ
jgi:hypothetical protein